MRTTLQILPFNKQLTRSRRKRTVWIEHIALSPSYDDITAQFYRDPALEDRPQLNTLFSRNNRRWASLLDSHPPFRVRAVEQAIDGSRSLSV